MRRLLLTITLMALAAPASGQTLQEVMDANSDGVLMYAKHQTKVFTDTDTSGTAIDTLAINARVYAYDAQNSFYEVAAAGAGRLGYVLKRDLAVDVEAESAARYASRGQGRTRKDPVTAAVLGLLVPGAGHMYAGSPGAGAGILAVAVSAPVAGYFLSTTNVEREAEECLTSTTDDCDLQDDLTPLYVGAVVGGIATIVGAIGAPEIARRYNKEHGLTATVVPAVRPSGGPSLAVRVRW